jgi:hypothetical protein
MLKIFNATTGTGTLILVSWLESSKEKTPKSSRIPPSVPGDLVQTVMKDGIPPPIVAPWQSRPSTANRGAGSSDVLSWLAVGPADALSALGKNGELNTSVSI